MTQSLVSGLITALFVLLATIVGALYARLRKLERQTDINTTQLSPLWKQVEARIAKELHHPHPRYEQMDRLLEKLGAVPVTITDDERSTLKELLKQRSLDMHEDITNEQRSSAALMIGVMDKVLEETAIRTDAPVPTPDPPPFPNK